MRTIGSIFVRDADVSIFVVKEENNIVIPVSEWTSSPTDSKAIAAAKRVSESVDYFLLNNDPYPSDEPDNLFKRAMQAGGIGKPINVAASFQEAVGKAALETAQDANEFDPSGFNGWDKLNEGIKQINRCGSVRVLAFLQSLVELRLNNPSSRPLRNATIPSLSGQAAIDWIKGPEEG